MPRSPDSAARETGRPLGAVEREFARALDGGRAPLVPVAALVELSRPVTREPWSAGSPRPSPITRCCASASSTPAANELALRPIRRRPPPWRWSSPTSPTPPPGKPCTTELNGPLPALDRAPLLRATLVGDEAADGPRGRHLVLNLVQVVFDGVTVNAFVRDWLAASEGGALAPAQAALPPPIERALGAPPSLLASAAFLARQTAGGLRRRHSNLLDSSAAHRYDQRRSRLEHRILGADVSRALAGAARANDTTLHGALSAALAGATDDLLSRAGHRGGWLRHGQSVNLRPFTDPPLPDDSLGCAVWGLPVELSRPLPRDLWRSARAIKRELSARIDRGQHLQAVHALSRLQPPVGALELFANARGRQGRMDTSFPSNLGRAPFPDDPDRLRVTRFVGRAPFPDDPDRLRVTRFVIASGPHVVGSLTWMLAVTVSGELQLTFAGVEPLLSRPQLAALADDVVARLHRAAAGPERC